MAQMLTLTVLTPERTLLNARVHKVRLRLADGAWLSLYPHHAPLAAETLPGPLQYVTEEGPRQMDLAGGLLHVPVINEVWVLTSGPREPAAAPVSAEEDELAQRFDRLARRLMLTLGAGAAGVVPAEDEA